MDVEKRKTVVYKGLVGGAKDLAPKSWKTGGTKLVQEACDSDGGGGERRMLQSSSGGKGMSVPRWKIIQARRGIWKYESESSHRHRLTLPPPGSSI